MLKIKGRHYKRVKAKKGGGCPKNSSKHKRKGRNLCLEPVAGPKKRKKRKK